MSLPPTRESRSALRFLAKQRRIWLNESQKYENFQFVIGFKLQTKSKRYYKTQTQWCGHDDIVHLFTEDTYFGNHVARENTHTDPDMCEHPPYNPPPEDYNIPGVEEWMCADLSPWATNVYEWAIKSRTFIKFAWFQEYKGTPHGIVKQPYSYVKKYPDLLFSWWKVEFPDIPFDTLEIGKLKNARRIVEYIHKRYILKDPSTLMSTTNANGTGSGGGDGGGDGGNGGGNGGGDGGNGGGNGGGGDDTTIVRTTSVPDVVMAMDTDEDGHQPVLNQNLTPPATISNHDIELMYRMLPPCDPVHLLEGQPVVLDMAQYQVTHSCSREETYAVFGYPVTDAWKVWVQNGGETTWTMIAEKQVQAHASVVQTTALVTSQRQGRRRVRRTPVLEAQIPVSKRSARIRKPSSVLHGTVVDAMTARSIASNTRNVGRIQPR